VFPVPLDLLRSMSAAASEPPAAAPQPTAAQPERHAELPRGRAGELWTRGRERVSAGPRRRRH